MMHKNFHSWIEGNLVAMAIAAAVEAAAPWLSSWLAPHVAGAYVQVAPASEPLKPPDATPLRNLAENRKVKNRA